MPAVEPQAELEAYAVQIGLPASDGASMFNHWEANGWMNGQNAIKDWRAGLRKVARSRLAAFAEGDPPASTSTSADGAE